MPQTVPFQFEELPFTDRKIELLKLQASIQQMEKTTRGGIVLISGEPGIGKTRLCDEARRFAKSKGIRWLSAKCTRGDDLAPYSPWIQLLKEFANQASVQLFYKVSGPYLNEIVKVIPELAESTSAQMTNAPEATSAEESTQRRLQLFQSITQFFVRLSKESTSLILFCDDLQWADPATIQLLRFFGANALGNSSILVLASYRDFDVTTGENPAVASFLKELENDRGYERIHLERFDSINVAELLSNLSDEQMISPEFMELIYSRTGGNPFFIEEVLRSLVERGDVFKDDNGLWDRKPISQIEIPQKIQGLIKQRIDRLDDETHEILSTASVIGEVFDFKVLRRVLQGIVDADSLLAKTIRIAQTAGFIRSKIGTQSQAEESGSVFTFSDEFVHDVLYEEIGPSLLKELHLRTGRVLEELSSTSTSGIHDEFSSQLAYHFLRGGDCEKALEYSIRAGDRAAVLFAHEEASKHFRQALELLPRDDKNGLLRADILAKLGEEISLHAGAPSSVIYLEEAAAIYEKNEQNEEAARIFGRLAEIYLLVLLDRDNSFRRTKKVIDLLSNRPPSFQLAWAYIGLGILHQWSGERKEAEECLARAQDASRKIGDPRTTAIIGYSALQIHAITEKQSALADLETAIEYLTRTNNDILHITYCHYFLASGYASVKGYSQKALELISKSLSYSVKVNNFGLVGFGQRKLFDAYLALGDWHNAGIIVNQLRQSFEKFPRNIFLRLLMNSSAGRLLLVQGKVEAAKQHLVEACKDGRLFGPPIASTTAFIDLGRLYAETDNFAEAKLVFDEGYLQSKSRGLAILTLPQHIELLSAMIELDARKEGKVTEFYDHMKEIAELAEQTDEPWAYAYCEKAKGIFNSHENNSELATQSYKKSVDYWRKLEWPYELARTLYFLAKEYSDNNDLENAKSELEEAITIFKRLGAKRDERVCLALLEKISKDIEIPETARSGRILAAIMFTDIVGYTKLTQENEQSAIALLEKHRTTLRPIFKKHFGREVDTIGDAFLVEFASALEAARCAVDVQSALEKSAKNSDRQKQALKIRIGIHLGDIERKGKKIYGDAVNIASRIEPLAEPGGVCITQQVYDQIRNYSSEFSFERLGPRELKNVNLPYEVYQIVLSPNAATQSPQKSLEKKNPVISFDKKRIAVLPFANLSADPNDEYFSDGITEELIDRLCQIRELEVIARTSIMRYKRKEAKASEIGTELQIEALIEGSVRKSGNKVRVTAQLIDVKTEAHLWSSKYDRELDDIFAVQSDIAERVAVALKLKLLDSERISIERKRTASLQAYELYLKGKFYWNVRTEHGLRKAIEYFRKALELDPRYALAYVGLADCFGIMGSQAFIDSKQAVAKAKECANAALEIDSEIAEAHATMGFIFTVSLQFGRAEQEFQRAIGLNPNYATARYFYSVHKTFVGDFDGALTEVMKARSLDPYSLQVNEYLAFVYYLTGDYERAIEQSKTALEIESGAITSHGWMALSYAEMGEFDKAIHEAEIAYKTGHPYGPGYLGYVYAKAGMKSEAIEVIRRVEEEEAEKKRNVDHGIIAMIYSCLAQYDGAFQELEQALKHGSMLLPALSSYPWFANLTHDQRFKILQAKLGLASL